MNDDLDSAAAFTEGLVPVMGETPPVPEWESLQSEPLSPTGGMGQWRVAAVAAALVVLLARALFSWQVDSEATTRPHLAAVTLR